MGACYSSTDSNRIKASPYNRPKKPTGCFGAICCDSEKNSTSIRNPIQIVNNPVPIAFWIVGAVVMGNFPSLFIFGESPHSFWQEILYSLPVGVIIITILVVMTFKRMVFTKIDEKEQRCM